MFKVLILQAMHALADERCEYLIKDRLSFMRFLGLGLADAVPTPTRFGSFREALKKARKLSTSCLRASTKCCEPRASWQCAARSSMRASSPRPSSATRRRRSERSRSGHVPEEWKQNGRALDRQISAGHATLAALGARLPSQMK